MFKTLRSQGFKSEHLLQWSISIDIIEQYAIYLIANDTKFDEISFYNCSSSWFDSHCQYTFDSNILIESFDEYRCHNGAQCIPLEFFRDGWTSKDCLDGTDEDEISINIQVNGDV
ncbi:unnamed protein product, partial [Rotaria sp. Silwood2]